MTLISQKDNAFEIVLRWKHNEPLLKLGEIRKKIDKIKEAI